MESEGSAGKLDDLAISYNTPTDMNTEPLQLPSMDPYSDQAKLHLLCPSHEPSYGHCCNTAGGPQPSPTRSPHFHQPPHARHYHRYHSYYYGHRFGHTRATRSTGKTTRLGPSNLCKTTPRRASASTIKEGTSEYGDTAGVTSTTDKDAGSMLSRQEIRASINVPRDSIATD